MSITDIEGVFAGGIHCGIKAKKKDLAFIYIPGAVASAGVFTQNKVVAPSIIHNRKVIKKNTLKAVIINSGNANTGLGKEGVENTKRMVKKTSELLGISQQEIAVNSTGIIGEPLPIETVEKGMETLLKNPNIKNGTDAAHAILTTDTGIKEVSKTRKIGKKQITISGITKGSGMIAPNMATTLGYIVTNADVPKEQLQVALSHAIDMSYNMSSVDTDTSTSDTVLMFATGKSKINVRDRAEWIDFQDLLNEVCIEMAKMVVRDGEGATKLIEVNVKGAPTIAEARMVAKSVIDSPLVKTAIYGNDPNWGRLLMAAGKTDTRLNSDKMSISIGSKYIFKDGDKVSFDREELVKELKQKEVTINFELNIGGAKATAWGCDLTEGYIKINTDYN